MFGHYLGGCSIPGIVVADMELRRSVRAVRVGGEMKSGRVLWTL